MRRPVPLICRRSMLQATLGAAFLLRPILSQAAEPTGIYFLDTTAIPVKAPDRVLLVAVARVVNRIVAVGEHGVIIYSDDDGISWLQAQVPVDVTLTCIAFATPLLGWAAGHYGVILGTVDGGKTWQEQLNGIEANQLTLVAAQQAETQGSTAPGAPLAVTRANHFVADGPDKPFLSLLVISSLKVIVFGAYRMTMITIDGGRSWNDWSLHIYDQFSHNIYGAAVIGQNYYLTEESGLVFRSKDGGNSFLPTTPTPAVTLFGVIGKNENSIIVYGVAGNCFRSTDGCNSWVAINLGTQSNLTAGRVLSSGAILLASEDGGLFASKDEGETFDAVNVVRRVPIFDIEQAPDDVLVLVGSTGVSTVSAQLSNT
jgi:photosystem II stability/assembly factor-like uncharacterized protein